MNDAKWEAFEDLLNEICNDNELGNWAAKRDAVVANVSGTWLNEFLNWFGGSIEEDEAATEDEAVKAYEAFQKIDQHKYGIGERGVLSQTVSDFLRKASRS